MAVARTSDEADPYKSPEVKAEAYRYFAQVGSNNIHLPTQALAILHALGKAPRTGTCMQAGSVCRRPPKSPPGGSPRNNYHSDLVKM